MPQMSPMLWLVFPFVMAAFVLMVVVTLNSDLNVVECEECGNGMIFIEIKW